MVMRRSGKPISFPQHTSTLLHKSLRVRDSVTSSMRLGYPNDAIKPIKGTPSARLPTSYLSKNVFTRSPAEAYAVFARRVQTERRYVDESCTESLAQFETGTGSLLICTMVSLVLYGSSVLQVIHTRRCDQAIITDMNYRLTYTA
jgi:hypothetical protein